MNGVASAKPYGIAKCTVWKAYQLVKANRGAAGIDDETIDDFEQDLSKNLYKLWNRMSSGSYFPPPVKQVEIPKAKGGTRKLGVPTVSDRVAQTVAKLMIEPKLDPVFHPDSYGYRPGKSAKQAIAVTRKRCWQYDWVVEFDIKAAFDQIVRQSYMTGRLGPMSAMLGASSTGSFLDRAQTLETVAVKEKAAVADRRERGHRPERTATWQVPPHRSRSWSRAINRWSPCSGSVTSS